LRSEQLATSDPYRLMRGTPPQLLCARARLHPLPDAFGSSRHPYRYVTSSCATTQG
jgi:hypothetical protein